MIDFHSVCFWAGVIVFGCLAIIGICALLIAMIWIIWYTADFIVKQLGYFEVLRDAAFKLLRERKDKLDNMLIGTVVKGITHEYKMTVKSINKLKVTVDYFDSENQLHTATYKIDELTIVE